MKNWRGSAGPQLHGRSCVEILLMAWHMKRRRPADGPDMPRLPSWRAGGCTFAEDPQRSFTSARPIWSAAIDPRVLVVRATPSTAAESVDFAKSGAEIVTIAGDELVHSLVRMGRHAVRIDLVPGAPLEGRVELEFRLREAPHLHAKIDTILRLRALLAGKGSCEAPAGEQQRCRKMLNAIRVADAIACGASLRTISAVLRPSPNTDDPWPGRGEHAKSWARRQVAAAIRLVARGPAAILALDPR
jgi:hypothetical protein